MFNRVFMAACAAGVAAALIAPVESAARGGAVSMGHVGGSHPSGIQPFNRARPPLVHAQRPLPLAASREAFIRSHEFRRAAFLNHRRFFRFGLPYTYGDSGPFYGSYYDASDVDGSLDQQPVTNPLATPGAARRP